MACHFSPYGTGLSNLPTDLPEGSMLILNDRTPIGGHDPVLIAEQLRDLAHAMGCSRVLLDLQRPGEASTAAVAKAVLEAAACPVAVSTWYAEDLPCPVFLPLVPLLQSPQDHLKAWQGREVWMEIAQEEATYIVTAEGCSRHPMTASAAMPHTDESLCCRYSVFPRENSVDFSVRKDWDMLMAAFENLPQITCLVGLYQELG